MNLSRSEQLFVGTQHVNTCGLTQAYQFANQCLAFVIVSILLQPEAHTQLPKTHEGPEGPGAVGVEAGQPGGTSRNEIDSQVRFVDRWRSLYKPLATPCSPAQAHPRHRRIAEDLHSGLQEPVAFTLDRLLATKSCTR